MPSPRTAMKTLLAILLLTCAAVRAQDSPPTAPSVAPPPVALPMMPAAPLARAVPVVAVPDAAALTAANSNRLETLRRQYQDRLAGRVGSNAPALIAPAAVPATRPPAALPLQPPAAVPAAPAALPAPASAGALSLPALNDANDPATNRMDFPAVDLNTFLTFYAEFIGRTILRPAALPAQQITLRTQTPLP